MAALLGFGQMGPFFLTGAAENLLAWGLLPETARAHITWGSWMLAALPLAVVTFSVAFTLTHFFFPPEFQPTISRGLIETQIEALGPPSRAEIVNGAVLVAAMVGMTLAVFAARFILPSLPLVSLLTLTVVPVAAAAGISPRALILVICTTVTVWFLPYQSTCYLALYFGTKEKAFSHGQVRLLAWSYGVIYLLAILVAIPYWWLLGLLP